MIQTMLLQIGVNSKIDAKTNDTLRTASASKDGFDLYCNTLGGPNMIGSWHLLFDNEVNSGYCTNWAQDDKLQELYKAASADATHDAEHMRAVLDYCVEQGYYYAIAGTSSALVYPKTITEIGRREGYVTPASSKYQGQ